MEKGAATQKEIMRPIFYDTETTGLRPKVDRVVEIALFDPTLNKTYCSFINPGIPIPPEQTAIHGIDDAMVKDAPSFADIAREFALFCQGDTVVIAHNNDTFDLLFLEAEFARAGLPFPSLRFLDSLKWARRYRPDLPRHTLQILREHFGIPENRAHRALDDVLILHQVFSHLIDDLSYDEVFRLMNKPRILHHMPFGKHAGKPLKHLPKDYLQWLQGSGALDKNENKELKESLLHLALL
jgi:DNA polymerase III subunit epsilon